MQYDSYKDSGEQWLGQIPSHWEIKRLGAYFSERRVKVSDKDYAPLSVTKNGILPQLDNVAKSNDSDNRKLVCAGDFVINSRSDRKGSSGVSTMDGSVSLINIVLQPRSTILSTYCNYLLKSYCFVEEYYRNGRGIVADLWTTRFDEMRSIKIAIPPLVEQERMVAYLDKETAAIDAAIAQQQKMIDLLNERKQIIIQQAVTKGLDPNAKMKDSGIDWIGQIPEGWDVMRTFFAFSNIGSGTTPKSGNVEYYAESGHCFLQTGDLNDGIIEDTSKKITDSALKDTNLRFYNSGALVIAMYGATIGKLGILKIKTTVNQACCVLTPKNNIDVWFALYFFMVAKQDLILQSKGGTQPNISQDTIKSEPFLTPPIAEQKKIVQYIQQVCKPLESAISKANEMISLLRERKQIIINEVVTGKIRV